MRGCKIDASFPLLGAHSPRLMRETWNCMLNLLAKVVHRRLLRARRERPHNGRAAECSQQFPPSDGDCHAPLQVRKCNDTTPRARCPNGAAPGAVKPGMDD